MGPQQNGTNGAQNGVSELPIVHEKQKIISFIRYRETSVIVSQTASGKTTEIPKFLYENGFCNKYNFSGAVCITQPRRVAATSVARYVAMMMRCQLGTLVGYSVRFDDVSSSATRIKYVTDGMLLRECLDDPKLMKYSVVILDEAHERTVNSDVLCALLRDIQIKRKEIGRPLKIIVMSATVNPEVYLSFFKLEESDLLFVPGRQYNVTINYTNEVQDDYVDAALNTVLKLVREKPNGDILVFCTGQEEIEAMVRQVNEASKHMPEDLKALPMYSALPPAAQERALAPLPGGGRKIIFATNIAETSITIVGIRYVVDTCRIKCRHFNPTTGMELLRVEKISQAQAWQRSGRAGRQYDGECYRLLTAAEFGALKQFQIAEIKKCSLANVLMSVLALKQDLRTFEWLENPAEDSVKQALETLDLLEGTKVNECGKILLNKLGSLMRKFPLEPIFSKCIFGAKQMNCVEPMVTIISMLSCDGSPLVASRTNEDSQPTAVRQFGSNEGDLIMYLNMYTKFNQANSNKDWCHTNGINRKTMSNVRNIRTQLRNVCAHLDMQLTKSTNENIRKALVSGLFRNIAYRVKSNQYKSLESRRDVFIHPSSCLFRQNPEVVLFTEVVQTTKCYIRNVTPVDAGWYQEFAPPEYSRKHPIPTSADD